MDQKNIVFAEKWVESDFKDQKRSWKEWIEGFLTVNSSSKVRNSQVLRQKRRIR